MTPAAIPEFTPFANAWDAASYLVQEDASRITGGYEVNLRICELA